ncbi:hypothetical protein PFISCL1PPCAC_3136, partial [Pristionchus fissidentatus]
SMARSYDWSERIFVDDDRFDDNAKRQLQLDLEKKWQRIVGEGLDNPTEFNNDIRHTVHLFAEELGVSVPRAHHWLQWRRHTYMEMIERQEERRLTD